MVNKLSNHCSLEGASQEQCLGTEPDRFDCCRAEAGYLADELPFCRFRETEAEAYRFLWKSSFNGAALVHIARAGDSVGLRSQVLGRSRLRLREPPLSSALSLDDWEELQRALTISDFWSLDADDEQFGLDGAQWLIEGRRGDIYRSVRRWSPRGAVYDLGRLFFAFAGRPLADLRLY